MNTFRAEAFIQQYGAGCSKLSEFYDADDMLQAALLTVFPNFEYPDFSHLTLGEIRQRMEKQKGTSKAINTDWQPSYSRWRHGGWYVSNVRYPNGANGCVSNNYPDKKWRIVCDDRRKNLNEEGDFTFPSRDAAARAEYELAKALTAAVQVQQ